MQHRITEKKLLLNETGSLNECGYATSLILDYDRKAIKAKQMRIKEWDYYLIGNDRFALALTIDDNSYMGLDSVSFLDFTKAWEHTTSPMQFMTKGRKNLPSTSEKGDIVSSGKGYSIEFLNDGKSRKLSVRMDDFMDKIPLKAEIVLYDAPEESMVIATPFKDSPLAFYYNQKINCMKAKGYVDFNNVKYVFDPSDSMAVLDWGRGVWTYKNSWYWGSGSGYVEGVPFGFNIGYGFGDTSKASENMLFYNGKAHKLDKVDFVIPHTGDKYDFMSPWKFTSNDNRFVMDFIPILDRASYTSLGIIKSDQHQVFGKFTGTAVLDDGKVINIKDFIGFAEKVFNKW
jgi:hypothetical protein